MKAATDFFSQEDDYPDLDIDGALHRLSNAIQYKTIHSSDPATTDFAPFEALQAHMQQSYPHVFAAGTFERIGHSVLITLPGSDSSLRPCLYMSHQDVVPVVEGTEADWTYPPFSGAVAEGYIWGRGTLDIKQQVFAILEAAEYLLSHGASFTRTAYLAFGDDEETTNAGALAIANTLKARGITLEFLLDEGSGKLDDGAVFGAPGLPVCSIDLMEKGYADLELSVKSPGGHSSRPFGGTSLGRLAQSISAIVEMPQSPALSPLAQAMLASLAPRITEEPLRSLVQDIPGNATAIAEHCLHHPRLFPFVSTTIAPTVIRGSSSACNVMPQDMEAVINFRIAEGDSVQALEARCRKAVTDSGVHLRFLQANDPSHTARMDGLGYSAVKESMEHYYPGVTFFPSMTVGATDAHQYEEICDTCIRCAPFLSDAADVSTGVHGTNERLSVRAYAQGIRVLIHLMEQVNTLAR
ncbi:MAG: M20/M25/M40 family metallo-hydrolase [Oscillibacter sp.]|nr:M20/M25/M40 family metallo-hydrolase [Oscillibacter sp.]